MRSGRGLWSVIRNVCLIAALYGCTLKPTCSQVIFTPTGTKTFLPPYGIIYTEPVLTNTIYDIPIGLYYSGFFEGILFFGSGYYANEITYGYSPKVINSSFPGQPGQWYLPTGAQHQANIYFEDAVAGPGGLPTSITAAIMPAEAALSSPEPDAAATAIALITTGAVLLWRRKRSNASPTHS